MFPRDKIQGNLLSLEKKKLNFLTLNLQIEDWGGKEISADNFAVTEGRNHYNN